MCLLVKSTEICFSLTGGEIEYGRTISAYQGLKTIDGRDLTVNYLRIGRIAFIYQSLDGRRLEFWDHMDKSWKPLSKRVYRSSVVRALSVARKQRAPEILKVPVPAPVSSLGGG